MRYGPDLHISQGYHGYVTFTWVYGLFTGGYQYRLEKEKIRKVSINLVFSLKMYVYQKVRARNFARAWGYIQVDPLELKYQQKTRLKNLTLITNIVSS